MRDVEDEVFEGPGLLVDPLLGVQVDRSVLEATSTTSSGHRSVYPFAIRPGPAAASRVDQQGAVGLDLAPGPSIVVALPWTIVPGVSTR